MDNIPTAHITPHIATTLPLAKYTHACIHTISEMFQQRIAFSYIAYVLQIPII